MLPFFLFFVKYKKIEILSSIFAKLLFHCLDEVVCWIYWLLFRQLEKELQREKTIWSREKDDFREEIRRLKEDNDRQQQLLGMNLSNSSSSPAEAYLQSEINRLVAENLVSIDVCGSVLCLNCRFLSNINQNFYFFSCRIFVKNTILCKKNLGKSKSSCKIIWTNATRKVFFGICKNTFLLEYWLSPFFHLQPIILY